MGQIRSVCILLILDRNTWNHITVWKLLVLDVYDYNQHLQMSKILALNKP